VHPVHVVSAHRLVGAMPMPVALGLILAFLIRVAPTLHVPLDVLRQVLEVATAFQLGTHVAVVRVYQTLAALGPTPVPITHVAPPIAPALAVLAAPGQTPVPLTRAVPTLTTARCIPPRPLSP
jgi:hypothetical protein